MVDQNPAYQEHSTPASQRLLALKGVTDTAHEIYEQNLKRKSRKPSSPIHTVIEKNYLKYYLSRITKAVDTANSIIQEERTVSLADDPDSKSFLATQLKGKLRLTDDRIDEICNDAKDYAGIIAIEALSGPIPLAIYSRNLLGLVSGQTIDPVLPVSLRLPTLVEGVFVQYSYQLAEEKKPQVSIVVEPL